MLVSFLAKRAPRTTTQVRGEGVGDLATGGGVKISVGQAREVGECAQRPRRQREDPEESDGDTSSDAAEVDAVLGTGKVVDTDDEKSGGSLASSSSGEDAFDDIIAKPLKPDWAAATGAQRETAAATGAPRLKRPGYEPLWSDPYFLVWSHPDADYVLMRIRHEWQVAAPDGMGVVNVTKRVTPAHYEEKCGDPIKSLLLLRAWALWRARQGGWANAQRGRERHFKEQEVLLERDVKALGSPCRLLGHRKANSMLQSWAPEVVARLRSSGQP